ncbi:MAG TPA: hypothetical protein VNT79_14855, partial [Phycisphaerae bacterium]|nr:hypothetical protein [Phycisphaerae bacterium]
MRSPLDEINDRRGDLSFMQLIQRNRRAARPGKFGHRIRKWQPAGEKFEEHGPQRIDVGFRRDRSVEHLGRHVRRRAGNRTAWTPCGASMAQPEIGNKEAALGGEHHVRGFDVAVDNIPLVQHADRPRRGFQGRQRNGRIQRPISFNDPGERGTVDV